MNKYCINCGSELYANSKFCAKCGAPVSAIPSTPPPIQKQFQEPIEKVVQKPVHKPVERTEKKASFSPPEEPLVNLSKKKKKSNLLCVILSILLMFQSAAVVLYGWPGLAINKSTESYLDTDKNYSEIFRGFSNITMSAKDYEVNPTLVNVGPDNTLVKTGNMVIDFGEFNLSEDGSLEIRDMGVKRDEENGFNAHCYDFSM